MADSVPDRLAIMQSPDDTPHFVEWDRVVEVASDLMTPLGMYPERFEVTEFPTGEQLRRMGLEG